MWGVGILCCFSTAHGACNNLLPSVPIPSLTPEPIVLPSVAISTPISKPIILSLVANQLTLRPQIFPSVSIFPSDEMFLCVGIISCKKLGLNRGNLGRSFNVRKTMGEQICNAPRSLMRKNVCMSSEQVISNLQSSLSS